jgi:hypothetical protein
VVHRYTSSLTDGTDRRRVDFVLEPDIFVHTLLGEGAEAEMMVGLMEDLEVAHGECQTCRLMACSWGETLHNTRSDWVLKEYMILQVDRELSKRRTGGIKANHFDSSPHQTLLR